MPNTPYHTREKFSASNHELIWKAFRKGKKWAFEKIYRLTYNDLYLFGLKFIKNPQLVEDIIQELYCKLWQKKKVISKPVNIKAYLLRCVRTSFINHQKRECRNTNLDELETFNLETSVEDIYIFNENQNTNVKILNEELNKLTPKQKEAIYLHYILEMNYNEVAEIMGIKNQSVRNFVHEGIVQLKSARDKFSR